MQSASLKNQASSRGGKNTKIHVIQLEEQGAVVCIPDKSNFKMNHSFDAELYKRCDLVERFFQRIKNFRHITFRFDKLADCFLNFVLLASVAIHC